MRVATAIIALLLFSLVPTFEVDATESRSNNHSVDIQGMTFAPNSITIYVGDSITWTNHESMQITLFGLEKMIDSNVGCFPNNAQQ